MRAAGFRWVQIQGPPAKIDDAASPSPKVQVPEGAEAIGFAMVAANPEGTDAANLVIRVSSRDDAGDTPKLRADAGDEQIGITGRQVTLNGSRSEPRGRIACRWIQVAGPRVRLEMEDGPIYSFVPQTPGVYRFALLVASEGAISKADFVTVSVGNPASPFGIEPSAAAPESLMDAARAAISEVPGGLDVAEALGESFDGVADRMDLYQSYSEAFRELASRLASSVPGDPARRAAWDDRLFAPLTARLIEAMRAEGLDLRLPEAQAAALNSAQRAKLADLFRAMSLGFRSTRPGPRLRTAPDRVQSDPATTGPQPKDGNDDWP